MGLLMIFSFLNRYIR